MSEYAADKAVFHPDRLHILASGGQPAPVHVLLVPSDLCNHDCNFCLFRAPQYRQTTNQLFGVERTDGTRNNNPNRMIPLPKVMEVLEDCSRLGVKAIEITGGGEPSVHPDFNSILRAAVDRFHVGLITHGALLRDQAIETLMQARWVRFSVDAGTPRTYSLMRRVSEDQYDRAISRIQTTVATKRRTGSQVAIGISFVVTGFNWLETLAAARLAKELGVDTFRISAEIGHQSVAHPQLADQLCRQCEDLATDEFKVINRWSRRQDDNSLRNPDYETCWYQHLTTFIGGDQNVYRCCTTAYNERGLLGSLKDQRFYDLWTSQDKRDSFSEFVASGCSVCHVNDRNRAIDGILHPDAHAAFV